MLRTLLQTNRLSPISLSRSGSLGTRAMNGIASRLKAVNELDPEKRKVLFEEVYDGLHKQFPGFVFHEVGEIEAHHGLARVHWELVKPGASVKPTGDDFIKIEDGRITEVCVIVNGQTRQAESAAKNNQQ